MPSDCSMPALLLVQARAGNDDALSRLLELYRNYLRLLARVQIDRALVVRLDASDIAQDAMIGAFRDFGAFAGASEQELVAWLRTILMRTIVDQARHHRSQKRDVRRQQSLELLLQTASQDLDLMLAGNLTSPTAAAANREFAVVVADALAVLPEDYRDVIVWHHFQGHSFVEIGLRIQRSPAAVRMLWVRGLERLRQVFGEGS